MRLGTPSCGVLPCQCRPDRCSPCCLCHGPSLLLPPCRALAGPILFTNYDVGSGEGTLFSSGPVTSGPNTQKDTTYWNIRRWAVWLARWELVGAQQTVPRRRLQLRLQPLLRVLLEDTGLPTICRRLYRLYCPCLPAAPARCCPPTPAPASSSQACASLGPPSTLWE